MSTGSNEMASVVSAYEGKKAAKAERGAQLAATNAALAEQKRQFDIGREDLAPYMETGAKSLVTINDLLGQNGPEAQERARLAFRTDPGYQFSVDEGLKAVRTNAAAAGSLKSGRALMALQDRGQGLADQQYSTYFNRLYNTANMGRGTATGMAGMGADYANAVSSMYGKIGDINANYYNRRAQGIQNMVGTIGQGAQYTSDKAIDTAASMYGMFGGGG